ncbi:MAG: nuclear transport factor 2 family protein [Anaerolineales bacterium]|nr:nuclear transport factor 2 family protein [Anaerolineales bacterium]
MYHAIMRSKVREVFDQLNEGKYDLILTNLAPKFEHWFIGEHALSGLRTSLPVTRQWYERLYQIFPNIHFDIKNIVVQGAPWDTTVTVEWDDSYTLLNGKKRSNLGVHIIHFKWFKADSIRIYCDTKLLLANLAIQAEGGVADVALPPLIG